MPHLQQGQQRRFEKSISGYIEGYAIGCNRVTGSVGIGVGWGRIMGEGEVILALDLPP